MYKINRKSLLLHGFTLIELLIVIAILGLLIILSLVNWRRQIDRANDSRRKSDLSKIRRAFEEYYNDHQCYPDLSVLNVCDGPELSPYLPKIPCDPVTGEKYKYVAQDSTNYCKGYRLLATLKDPSDPEIIAQGCHPTYGCGFGSGYNYGVAVGGPVADSSFDPHAIPTPTPGAPPGNWACTKEGVCNSIGAGNQKFCPRTFADGTDCKINGIDQCQFVINRCSI